MTTSTWDSSEIATQFGSCQNLKEVIARLESEFSNRGEVICEIKINGMTLNDADEAKFATNPVEGIQTMTVQSQRPSTLIVDAMDSALAFLPELESYALAAAEAMRISDLKHGGSTFISALDGCQWLVDTIVHMRGAASGIGDPIAQPEKWFQAEKHFGQVVAQVSEAYANADTVLVADILEYELTSAIQVWREALGEERARRA